MSDADERTTDPAKASSGGDLENQLEEILTGLCEDCDGKGYFETGGMAMEDDLVERTPCVNKLHDKQSTTALLKAFQAECLRVREDERNHTAWVSFRLPSGEYYQGIGYEALGEVPDGERQIFTDEERIATLQEQRRRISS